jgi:hypothetical protein
MFDRNADGSTEAFRATKKDVIMQVARRRPCLQSLYSADDEITRICRLVRAVPLHKGLV